MEGLGALIISPTRELAVQIFEVLQKVGKGHRYAAGLVIGGKSLQDEQAVASAFFFRLMQTYCHLAGYYEYEHSGLHSWAASSAHG